MGSYIKIPQGFISQAPHIQFERCDGVRFYSDTGTAGSMSSTDNNTAIYGGWGKTPLGFVDGDSTMDISYTDAVFYRDMYTIGSAGSTTSTADTTIKSGGIYTVVTGLQIKLPFQVDPSSVKINGFTTITTGTVEAGKCLVGAYDDTNNWTPITFATNDVAIGDDLLVTYCRRVAQADVTTIPTTGGAARGSLVMTWPVMSAGTDCSQAAIVGLLHLKVPRVMVTTRASLDASRGTAATPNIVFSAVDAHRGDGKWYDIIYEEYDNGTISTDYDSSTITIWD